MELSTYVKLFKKYSVFIILCATLGAILGLVSTAYLPQGFNLSQTFYIASPEIPPQQANFDSGFYSQERARNYTDTAVAILESADFQKDALSQGGSIGVKKLAPQVIRLTAVTQSKNTTKDLLANVANSFNQKLADLNGSSQALSIKQISQAQEPSFKRSSRKIYASAGVLIGFTMSVAAISLKSYFKL